MGIAKWRQILPKKRHRNRNQGKNREISPKLDAGNPNVGLYASKQPIRQKKGGKFSLEKLRRQTRTIPDPKYTPIYMDSWTDTQKCSRETKNMPCSRLRCRAYPLKAGCGLA